MTPFNLRNHNWLSIAMEKRRTVYRRKTKNIAVTNKKTLELRN